MRLDHAYQHSPVRSVPIPGASEPASASREPEVCADTCERPHCPYCGMWRPWNYGTLDSGHTQWRCRSCKRKYSHRTLTRKRKPRVIQNRWTQYGDGGVYLRYRTWWAHFRVNGKLVRKSTGVRGVGQRQAALEALRQMRVAGLEQRAWDL